MSRSWLPVTQIIDNGKGEPAPVDVYTLEVTPEEGEKLTLGVHPGPAAVCPAKPHRRESILTRGATISQTLAPP